MKMVSLEDILQTIDICRSVIVAKQEAAANEITREKTQTYIMEKTREIERLGNVRTGIDIVEHSIEKIYKEEEK